MQETNLLASVLGITLVAILWWYAKRARTSPYKSPGPPALPIIGHLLSIPLHDQAETYQKWGKRYGDVLKLNIVGKTLIVLNSEEAATDLLEKRGQKYSDRPRLASVEVMGWDRHMVWAKYGKEFHMSRKLFQDQLSLKQCEVFQDRQIRQARIMVKNIVKDPTSHRIHMLRFVASVITEVAFGHEISSPEDNYLQFVEKFTEDLGQLASSRTIELLGLFPFLKNIPQWFPGAGFKRHANLLSKEWEFMETYFCEEVQKELKTGNARPSFLANHLETLMHSEKHVNDEDINRLKAAAFLMYLAGNETTWAGLSTFILAMLLRPHVQRKAQDEIDKVVGKRVIPDLSDREALPFVEAVMQETLRWFPPVPLGNSQRIQALSSITHDEGVYHNPDEFYPERYFSQALRPAEPYPKSVWGFGRRICPGRHLAESSLWTAIVHILATVNIRPAKDSMGEDIIPPVQYTTHLTR
ncbi:hypothetical protein NLI96_g3079 [Meripilus lineatus]|uniref:Cytochrome P450 n=1 Tax=Meripilus lineatus TaxID=2056292 RepID=A0AAD5V913_9APHY|nr:hypothetical protein NLI96_g3079 [Physisporinus lineatus]